MIIIISPSKNVNFKPQDFIQDYTIPDFLDRSQLLMSELRKLSPKGIAQLMKVSSSIADLNFRRYMDWNVPFTPENAKQSILAFNGEVYHGMMASTFTSDDFTFAQEHLRILSGLYGLLRPLDLIQPYRLEMGIKLKSPRAADVYKFWGNRITEKLNDSFKAMENPVLINLSSAEYSKVVKPTLKAKMISIEFWEGRDGGYKTIVIYTKKARGMMSRFIIKHRLLDPEDLKGFDEEGYMYNSRFSTQSTIVFTRN